MPWLAGSPSGFVQLRPFTACVYPGRTRLTNWQLKSRASCTSAAPSSTNSHREKWSKHSKLGWPRSVLTHASNGTKGATTASPFRLDKALSIRLRPNATTNACSTSSIAIFACCRCVFSTQKFRGVSSATTDKTGCMIPARLTVVTLGVRDMAKLRAFYEALGWGSRAGSNDDFTAFVLGGVVLALYPRELLQAEAASDVPARPDASWSGITLALNVDTREQVDEVYDAAVAAGARLVSPPVDREWGGRSGYVADPEDNRWEIVWAPGLTFTDAGAVLGP
jgi:uncharacterized protein